MWFLVTVMVINGSLIHVLTSEGHLPSGEVVDMSYRTEKDCMDRASDVLERYSQELGIRQAYCVHKHTQDMR